MSDEQGQGGRAPGSHWKQFTIYCQYPISPCFSSSTHFYLTLALNFLWKSARMVQFLVQSIPQAVASLIQPIPIDFSTCRNWFIDDRLNWIFFFFFFGASMNYQSDRSQMLISCLPRWNSVFLRGDRFDFLQYQFCIFSSTLLSAYYL